MGPRLPLPVRLRQRCWCPQLVLMAHPVPCAWTTSRVVTTFAHCHVRTSFTWVRTIDRPRPSAPPLSCLTGHGPPRRHCRA